MSKDSIISVIATVVLGIAVSVMGRDWLIGSFSADPAAAICFTLCALALGYFISSLVHRNDRSAAERDELAETVRAQREEIAQSKVQIAKLESELASDRGLSVDEVRKAIADELAKEDYRKLWRPDYGNQKPLTWGTLVGVPDGRPERPGEHCQREGAPGRAGRRGASEEGEATA